MKETLLYGKFNDNAVRCNLCHHRCIIQNGQRGICGVRKNENNKLVSLVYGQPLALNVDPIEKKPLFHFLPGSFAFSLGTLGCNFGCLFCQNWEISQTPKKEYPHLRPFASQKWPPSKIVTEALKNNCQSIAYTYNEPTVFLEYALEIMKLAREANLKNVWVSNGYMTPETLRLIAPYLDAINIDLKSFSKKFYREICGAKLEIVLENLKNIKKQGIWLEVTTLIIPQKNDSSRELKQIASFIFRNLGTDVPWHLSRFYPAYKMATIPITSRETIEKAIRIGKKIGLKYVYAGNLPKSPYENTYCPACNNVVIERTGYIVRRFDKDGRCPQCSTKIAGVFV